MKPQNKIDKLRPFLLSCLGLRVLRITIFVLFIIFVMGKLMGHISITKTDSLNDRVYFIDEPRDRTLYGDIFVFDFEVKQKTVKVMKKIACLPGDQLHLNNGQFFCNDSLIGTVNPRIAQQSKIKVYHTVGVIAEGYYFMIGDTDDSYDSKYFGPVHKSRFKKQAFSIYQFFRNLLWIGE
jgi:conjugal transfer pilin signal peptidase TrbI